MGSFGILVAVFFSKLKDRKMQQNSKVNLKLAQKIRRLSEMNEKRRAEMEKRAESRTKRPGGNKDILFGLMFPGYICTSTSYFTFSNCLAETKPYWVHFSNTCWPV